MDINDRIRDLSKSAKEQQQLIQTELDTRHVLVNPFIQKVLGYNIENLNEVKPDYIADIGVKKGEKVDYAIFHDGKPLILIEAKKVGTPLDEEKPDQLYRYFSVTPSAKFGIYTDGIKYLFYTNLDEERVMDKSPFMVFDLQNIDPSVVEEIAKFAKSKFDPDAIRNSAERLKYTHAIQDILQTLLDTPSEKLVKSLMGMVYSGTKTKANIRRFADYVKIAAQQFVLDQPRVKPAPTVKHKSPPVSTSQEIPIRFEYKKMNQVHNAILQEDGGVRLPDGIVLTPSGACAHLTGRDIWNGWDSWKYKDKKDGQWRKINDLHNTEKMKKTAYRYWRKHS
jgi:hypothetical protein